MKKRPAYKVVLTGPAERDLVHTAARYLERHQAGEARVLSEFGDATALLAQQPLVGRDRSDLRPGLLSWLVHPFVVFYVVDETHRRVKVVRVMHGSIDTDEDDVRATARPPGSH